MPRNRSMNRMQSTITSQDIDRLTQQLNSTSILAQQQEDELLNQKLSNLERVDAYRRKLVEQNANRELRIEEDLNAKKNAYTEQQAELDTKLATAKANKDLKQLEKLQKKKIANDKKYNKLVEKAEKDKEKRDKKATERIKKQAETQAKLEKARESRAETDRLSSTIFGKDSSLKDRKNALKQLKDEKGPLGLIDGLVSGLADVAKQLEKQIDDLTEYQNKIDTRLYGSGRKYEGTNGLLKTLTNTIGISPYVKTKDVLNNLNSLVDKGIAFNVEQRAFLQTISDNIATTFDAANGTLLQLIRIQQSDTTAARLGLESSLNEYLNKMFQTTEYLSDISDAVSSSIYEATSQLSAAESVAFEYQVQKWLGSLYSVGMSSSGIQSIASALGMLGSGNISGLNSNQAMQNLLALAVSKSGGRLDYAELLANGIDSSQVNILMQSMVNYLAEIASNNNKVVQSSFANIFGLSTSDLKAIANLSSSTATIASQDYSYKTAIDKLNNMADTMYQRLSLGNMMSNAWDNIQYGIASGIASSPALYGLWKVTGLLESAVGGINIPTAMVLGTGVDLNTTVADLMRVGVMGAGLLSSIGGIIEAASKGSSAGFSGSGMLKSLGIDNSTITTISRGSGLDAGLQGGITTSQTIYTGNSSDSDLYNSTLAGAESQKQSAMTEASGTEKSDMEKDIETIEDNIATMKNILYDIAIGRYTIKVDASLANSPFN